MAPQPYIPIRVPGGVLGTAEKSLLIRMAKAMPGWISSDMLTVVGIAGAAITCLGYVLSNVHVGYLWLASAGLVINWFGDSLDGTLARVRQLERPRYGFLVDHSSDVVSELLVGAGLGLSPFVHFDVACMALIVYLACGVFTFLKTIVSGEFQISYGGIGPTEVRIALIAGNTALLWYKPPVVAVLWEPLNAIDILVLAVAAIVVVALVIAALRELHRIAQSES